MIASARETTTCPGCHQPVDITRDAGMPVIIEREEAGSAQSTVVIRIGRIEIHRCRRCSDGTWR